MTQGADPLDRSTILGLVAMGLAVLVVANAIALLFIGGRVVAVKPAGAE
jgi:hypothetical protein